MKTAEWLLAALAPVLLLVLGFTASQELRQGRELRAEVNRTYDARSQIQRVFSLMQDAETGQRGYIITGRPEFLEPWRRAEAELPGQLGRLEQLFSQDPVQQAALARLQSQAEAKLRHSARTIRMRREMGADAATDAVADGHGKALMDALRVTADGMIRREAAELHRRLDAADQSANATAWISALLLLALACVLATAVILLQRTSRLRSAVIRAAEERAEQLGRDIEERREAEAALAAALVQAEAANVAQAEFLANMSHELRTPLTSMMGYGALLEGAEGLTPDEQRFVRRIRSAGQVLLTTVNDVLDFSRLEAGQLELDYQRVELGAFLADNAAMVAPTAQAKGLSLQVDPVPADAWVEADPVRLRQVMLNLLNNALKFTDGGVVALRCRVGPETVRFQVADTGPGIPADKICRLFKRFSQVDGSVVRSHGGSGLGLAICKSLVDAMDGRIGVSTAEGAGSIFWFEIPARAPARMLEAA